MDIVYDYVPDGIRKPLSALGTIFHTAKTNALGLSPKSKRTRKIQLQVLSLNYDAKTPRMIIFLTPGYDVVNGGILSISSIYEETKKLKAIHGSETLLCTYPGDPQLLKYTRFKNENQIMGFSDVLQYFTHLDSLQIHIPEVVVKNFEWRLTRKDRALLRRIPRLHLNILIQNIEYLPYLSSITKLKRLGKVTATTAHTKYSTQELRTRLGIPLHKFSTFLSPEKYYFRPYEQKEDLMIVSPDKHPKKTEVLELLASKLPNLKVKIIENLTYEQYKLTISRAKWALTFGEGLDGYFLETIFSGGISFSVYNSKFFPDDFKYLFTVYENYEVLKEKICRDIARFNNEKAYTEYQKKEFELGCNHYDYKNYLRNLEAFYKGDYTFK